MDKLYYDIEIRDKNNKPFVNDKGHPLLNCFKFETQELSKEDVEKQCILAFLNYKAITGNSNIMITVTYLNPISGTHPVLYTYWGKENKFIKH